MILLLAIATGLLVGLAWARWRGRPYQSPALRSLWLALIAFLPQLLVVYLPLPRKDYPDPLVAFCILASQILFLGFAWVNRRLPGMSILIFGLVINLAVMSANRGFMPINPQVAGRLSSQETLKEIPTGSRFGTKDILLLQQDTRLEWLADRFLPPSWLPYQVAFSLGDVLIGIGVFWLLAKQSSLQTEGI